MKSNIFSEVSYDATESSCICLLEIWTYMALHKFTVYFAGVITAPNQAFSEGTYDTVKSTSIYVCTYGLVLLKFTYHIVILLIKHI